MIVFFVCFCLFGVNWLINGLFFFYLVDNGVNIVVILILMTIVGLGILIGIIFFGFVGDKIGVKKVFVVGLIILFIFFCFFFFIFVKNFFFIGLCFFGLMFINLGIVGLVLKFIYDYFLIKLRGLGIGFIYNLGVIGGMVVFVLVIYILGYYGLGVLLFIVMVVFFVLLILLVGFDILGKIYKLFVVK